MILTDREELLEKKLQEADDLHFFPQNSLLSIKASYVISGLDNTRGFLQMTFDTGIGVIELWDFKVCSEARNG